MMTTFDAKTISFNPKLVSHENFAVYPPPAVASLLCALLFGLWACTPEAIPPPEPVPSLAAGAPQGGSEDVQEECACYMRINAMDGLGFGEFLMPNFTEDFDFNLHSNGFWEFLPTGEQGFSYPTSFFPMPGTFTEQNCEQFALISFSGPFNLDVTVQCFRNGKDDTPDSQVSDQFIFNEGIISNDGLRSIFYRQYICRERPAGDEDPCKGGPGPG